MRSTPMSKTRRRRTRSCPAAHTATRLPAEVKEAVPDVPWDNIRDIRVVVDHVDHRIDYESLWTMLANDVPFLVERLGAWARTR